MEQSYLTKKSKFKVMKLEKKVVQPTSHKRKVKIDPANDPLRPAITTSREKSVHEAEKKYKEDPMIKSIVENTILTH